MVVQGEGHELAFTLSRELSMRFPIALGVATTMVFAAGTSVASAQLSSRSANGGLFHTLVDWNPVAEEALLGVGDVRMSPWSANRVELGTVKPADPNRPWMGYWGHTEDRELANVVGAQHSLRANPIAYANSLSRGQSLFMPDVPLPNVAAAGGSNAANNKSNAANNNQGGQGQGGGAFPALPPGGFGPQVALAPGVAPNVIVNPEPESYWLAAAGLVVIALIRRYRLA